MQLNEGGNVVPNAVELQKANFPLVMANLKKILPQGLNLYPIGSAGHKEVSSDIDALIDASELMKAFPAKELKLSRKALEDYFIPRKVIFIYNSISDSTYPIKTLIEIGNKYELETMIGVPKAIITPINENENK